MGSNDVITKRPLKTCPGCRLFCSAPYPTTCVLPRASLQRTFGDHIATVLEESTAISERFAPHKTIPRTRDKHHFVPFVSGSTNDGQSIWRFRLYYYQHCLYVWVKMVSQNNHTVWRRAWWIRTPTYASMWEKMTAGSQRWSFSVWGHHQLQLLLNSRPTMCHNRLTEIFRTVLQYLSCDIFLIIHSLTITLYVSFCEILNLTFQIIQNRLYILRAVPWRNFASIECHFIK